MIKTKISSIEAILLILSVLAPFTVTSLSKTILNETKSSSLLNIIYVTIICLLIVLLIYKLFKRFPGVDILDISQYLSGNFFKNLIGIIFILYFIVTSSMLLRNFCEGLSVVYYPSTNIIFIIALFAISIGISNSFGFNSTIKTTIIIFPIILVSIILLFFGNINHFSFHRITPVLGDGFTNTFLLGLTNIGTFSGIAYIYFLPPLLKEPNKFKKISILSIIFSGLFIFICIATLLFMFSIFITIDDMMPLFLASRYIEFGSFFQRFESLFLLIWIISFCCYLSISCKFSTYIFKKIFNLNDFSPLTFIFVLSIFAVALLPKNYIVSDFFESHIYRYLSIFIIFLGLIILVLSNLKRKTTEIHSSK